MEAEDVEEVQRTFAESTHEIDVEHKRALEERLVEHQPVSDFELLYHATNPDCYAQYLELASGSDSRLHRTKPVVVRDLLLVLCPSPATKGLLCQPAYQYVMVTNDEGSVHEPDEGDMLPDEAAVLPERGERLDETDEDDLLTTDEAGEHLGIDFD
ncbi:MAG: hypothetical protein ABEJ88_07995 [Halobacterium sp.]